MQRGYLSEYFTGAVSKRLSAVEASCVSSNQHEFNGTVPLRNLFGDDDRKNIPARFIYISDDQEPISTDGLISWYDARRRHPTRTEYRLYYVDNDVSALMQEGDVFIVALRPDGSAMIIITPCGSSAHNQIAWLFDFPEQPGFSFQFQTVEGRRNPKVGYIVRHILEELGIEVREPDAGELDDLIDRFNLEFPSTRVFSRLARESLPGVSALDGADDALVAWMDREELLFKRLERKIVSERLRIGFSAGGESDVDGFLKYSLSVLNRRKARAGQALENHLEEILQVYGIRHVRGAETENRNKPDFLFPGQAEYADPSFPSEHLTMLGVKSTLKDRWRQVLSEACRIEPKHLLTLEAGISVNQTDEMRAKNLQLVVPRSLHTTFTASQQGWLWTVRDFIALVQERQRHSGNPMLLL